MLARLEKSEKLMAFTLKSPLAAAYGLLDNLNNIFGRDGSRDFSARLVDTVMELAIKGNVDIKTLLLQHHELGYMISTIDPIILEELAKEEPCAIFYINIDLITLQCIKNVLAGDDQSVLDDLNKSIYARVLDEETALALAIYDSDLLDKCKNKDWYVDVMRLAALKEI